jgi:hypothetical protein
MDELYWHDLKTDPPPGDGCVVLFPCKSDVGIFFETRLYTSSNPEYARITALGQGYTHWFPIPSHPDEEKIRKEIEEWVKKEQDLDAKFYEGFNRASENIAEFIKQIVPDRPEVYLAVRARFLGNKD